MLDTKDLETTVNYPQLYQLSDAGNIKTWIISVKRISETESQIIKQFGILGGKMQSVSDPITEGKNAGKANETTPHQQAVAEAESAHSKKKKKGYVDTLLGAENGELDEVITGGVEPMLAHVYAKRGDKITFPAYAQPKLDGMRCIAIKKGNSVTLWTRTRKPIVSCPHIEEAIAIQFAGQDITLDGELYNHDMKSDFERIIGAGINRERGGGRTGQLSLGGKLGNADRVIARFGGGDRGRVAYQAVGGRARHREQRAYAFGAGVDGALQLGGIDRHGAVLQE